MSFWTVLAGLVSGILGAMGLGGGGVLILYLTLFENVPQLKSQGINLMFFIPCAAVATAIYIFKKQISPKQLLPYIIGGLFGAAAGAALSGVIETDVLQKLFGAALCILGTKDIFTVFKSCKKSRR